jgi:DNA-binding response OmpR family regulator
MPKRVMCVDDEVNLLKLYEQELKDEGYQVVPVSSSEEAIEEIGRRVPDLVVLDIMLGEDDGMELLDQIRREHRDLPVVLHSAYSIYKYNFQSWLADDYLIKSSDLSELKTKIRELLSF